MRRLPVPRVLAVLILVMACNAKPTNIGPSLAEPSTKGEQPPPLWNELLSCAEAHTQDCKQLIAQTIATRAEGDPVRKLATIVSEEWELTSSSAASLARARRVYVPMPPPEDARLVLPPNFESVLIVVSGVVAADGAVEDVVLLRPSRFDALNTLVADAFSRALYRPARSRRGFVTQRVEFLYRLEPRS